MKALSTFFNNLSASKTLYISLTPVVTAIISMKAALLGLFFLIIIDLITGIRKTQHEWNVGFNIFKPIFWKSIKSYLLRQTWKKTYEYGIGILVIIIFESLVFGTSTIMLMDKTFTLSELATVLPAMIEVWSIFENLESVSGTNILKRLQFLLPESVRRLFKGDKKKETTPADGYNNIEEYEEK